MKDLIQRFEPGALPAVKGWKLLVMPVGVEEVSAGGIVIPKQAQESNKVLGQVAQVIGMGSLCYEDEKFGHEGLSLATKRWCSIGDWVLYGQYKGDNITVKDKNGVSVDLVILNDDHVIATVGSPESIVAYV